MRDSGARDAAYECIVALEKELNQLRDAYPGDREGLICEMETILGEVRAALGLGEKPMSGPTTTESGNPRSF